jgi:hypothetical protein
VGGCTLLKQIWSDGRQGRERRKGIPWAGGGWGSIKKDYDGFNISRTRVRGNPELTNGTRSDAEPCADTNSRLQLRLHTDLLS